MADEPAPEPVATPEPAPRTRLDDFEDGLFSLEARIEALEAHAKIVVEDLKSRHLL